MFGIGGFNPVNLLASVALGPLGGIASSLLTQLTSSIGQQLLQMVGDKLGLPQSTIDMAQGAFAGTIGDFQGAQTNLSELTAQFAEAGGLTPAETGSAQAQLDDLLGQSAAQLAEGQDAKEARAGGRGGSWLMALARALGETADKLAGEMEGLAGELGEGANKSSANVEFAAKSQEFSQFFSSAINVIKTLGEALSSGARKG